MCSGRSKPRCGWAGRRGCRADARLGTVLGGLRRPAGRPGAHAGDAEVRRGRLHNPPGACMRSPASWPTTSTTTTTRSWSSNERSPSPTRWATSRRWRRAAASTAPRCSSPGRRTAVPSWRAWAPRPRAGSVSTRSSPKGSVSSRSRTRSPASTTPSGRCTWPGWRWPVSTATSPAPPTRSASCCRDRSRRGRRCDGTGLRRGGAGHRPARAADGGPRRLDHPGPGHRGRRRPHRRRRHFDRRLRRRRPDRPALSIAQCYRWRAPLSPPVAGRPRPSGCTPRPNASRPRRAAPTNRPRATWPVVSSWRGPRWGGGHREGVDPRYGTVATRAVRELFHDVVDGSLV